MVVATMSRKAEGPCSIDRCDSPVFVRGWCSVHYWRWYNRGDPLWEPPTSLDKFFDRVLVGDGCWEWIGTTNRSRGTHQYGQFKRDGHLYAHRWSYEYFVGPIPEGLQLDHLCRNTLCVNPAHLEPVTAKENTRRGVTNNAAKTHCPRGHPYDEANTYYFNDRLHRSCRTCRREVWASTKKRPKAESEWVGLHPHEAVELGLAKWSWQRDG